MARFDSYLESNLSFIYLFLYFIFLSCFMFSNIFSQHRLSLFIGGFVFVLLSVSVWQISFQDPEVSDVSVSSGSNLEDWEIELPDFEEPDRLVPDSDRFVSPMFQS